MTKLITKQNKTSQKENNYNEFSNYRSILIFNQIMAIILYIVEFCVSLILKFISL